MMVESINWRLENLGLRIGPVFDWPHDLEANGSSLFDALLPYWLKGS